MEIRIEPHTLRRAQDRGVAPHQIEDVLRTGETTSAYGHRAAKVKIYPYDGVWRGKKYDPQRVKVICTIEGRRDGYDNSHRERRHVGGAEMTIEYTENIDVLYIRLDDKPQQVANEEVDGVVLDIGEDNRIVGIEILDASKRLRLDRILPVHFRKTA